MNKLLSIVGPTATGKTNAAMSLAKKLINKKLIAGVDLISADSRQVYQGLEVLTGADIPAGFTRKSRKTGIKSQHDFFANSNDSIRIYGISIIKPTDEWSVAHFQLMAQTIITQSWKTHRLPILVGGTGLYHDQIFTQDKQLHVGPNLKVRQKAESMTVAELQHWLNQLNNSRFEQMNHSDQYNPRRLIRAIEIVLADVNQAQVKTPKIDRLTLALTAPLELIQYKISQRVTQRFQSGAVEEVKTLFGQVTDQSQPALSTLGVNELNKFLSGEINEKDYQKLWALHEFQYAKRQLTWWKHYPNLTWSSIIDDGWQKAMALQVTLWLSTGVEAS